MSKKSDYTKALRQRKDRWEWHPAKGKGHPRRVCRVCGKSIWCSNTGRTSGGIHAHLRLVDKHEADCYATPAVSAHTAR